VTIHRVVNYLPKVVVQQCWPRVKSQPCVHESDTLAIVLLCQPAVIYNELLGVVYTLKDVIVLKLLQCVSKKTSPTFLAITGESIVGFS